MKTITIASGKGGSAKTTCTALLAVQAMRESLKVAMLDLNADQGNLTDWWHVRGGPFNPMLIEDLRNIKQDVEALGEAGYEWLFIDTPPLEVKLIEQAIAVADAVVIPVRASVLDISATELVLSLCRKHRKPFAFLLTAHDKSMSTLADKAIHLLTKMMNPGGEIIASRMSYRKPYIQAMASGKTAPEIDKKLAEEAGSIWEEVKQLADRKRAGGAQ